MLTHYAGSSYLWYCRVQSRPKLRARCLLLEARISPVGRVSGRPLFAVHARRTTLLLLLLLPSSSVVAYVWQPVGWQESLRGAKSQKIHSTVAGSNCLAAGALKSRARSLACDPSPLRLLAG